jgi:arginase family enzyme
VLRAAAALGSLPLATQLGLYELNPRFDQDGASARLAARLAWSYLTGLL